MDPAPSGSDAIVAASADALAARADVLIATSDGGDLSMLASLAEHVERRSLLIV